MTRTNHVGIFEIYWWCITNPTTVDGNGWLTNGRDGSGHGSPGELIPRPPILPMMRFVGVDFACEGNGLGCSVVGHVKGSGGSIP